PSDALVFQPCATRGCLVSTPALLAGRNVTAPTGRRLDRLALDALLALALLLLLPAGKIGNGAFAEDVFCDGFSGGVCTIAAHVREALLDFIGDGRIRPANVIGTASKRLERNAIPAVLHLELECPNFSPRLVT